MKTRLIILLLLCFKFSFAQEESRPIKTPSVGFGIRTTGSVFLGDNAAGFGSGGQWKGLFWHRVNTEWYLDILNSSAGLNGYRKDTHIGWSVQFAVNKGGYQTRKPIPFVEAGQCFDWTKVGYIVHEGTKSSPPYEVGPIFSAATQAGAGVSWFPVSRLEFTAEAQYMIHITKDVHLEFDNYNFANNINQSNGIDFSGHILGTLGITWYIIQSQKKS